MGCDATNDLIRRLLSYQLRRAHIYRHRWRVGDVFALYHNTLTILPSRRLQGLPAHERHPGASMNPIEPLARTRPLIPRSESLLNVSAGNDRLQRTAGGLYPSNLRSTHPTQPRRGRIDQPLSRGRNTGATELPIQLFQMSLVSAARSRSTRSCERTAPARAQSAPDLQRSPRIRRAPSAVARRSWRGRPSSRPLK